MREPSITSQVEDFLRDKDEFFTIKQIATLLYGELYATHDERRSKPYNRVHCALHHLRKRHVVDVVIEPDGVGWWFALPQEEDDRTRKVDEKRIEDTPRKARRSKIIKVVKKSSSIPGGDFPPVADMRKLI